MGVLDHKYQLQRSAGDLFQSEQVDITNMPQGGIGADSRLILIQRKDITGITDSSSTQDIIEAITLAAAKVAHVFEGFRQSLKPKYRSIPGPAGNTMYVHELDYFVYGYAQTSKNNVQAKGNGRYVAIYQNAKQDEHAFEVMGIDVGLQLLEFDRAPGENAGSMRIKLATPEAEPEARMPKTFYDGTSFATTEALILALAKLPTITSFAPLAVAAAGGTAITITGTNYFGGGPNNAVVSVDWINQDTGAVVSQTFTTVSDTSITLNSAAMAAGLYKVKIRTLRGTVTGTQNLVVS